MLKVKSKGFTLLEMILVLGIGSAVTFMKFQDMVNDQESLKASAAGQQIKQLGDAVNGYINIRYDKLSTLANALGTGIDPGPRICTTGNATCTITTQTLVNEGLLPSTYVGRNAFGSDYSIQFKRNGVSPNYVIDGIIVTNNAWIEGGKTRFDLLGKAMQAAGIDSGMSQSSTQVNGYGGNWNYTASSLSVINKTGQLGYRVGYNSAMYSVYLRRDGTLPMTGALNMGANDINNAKNITASGNGNFGGNVIAGGEVSAENGYGDVITLGGDAASNDYELRLGSGKQLTIYSPNAASYSTTLRVNRNTIIDQRLSTNGIDPNDVPSSWVGGLRTYDVLSSGSVAVVKSGKTGSTGDWATYMNNGGNIYASNNITSSNTINAGGRILGGDVYSNSETYTQNWFRTLGDGGIYFQKYGGGWNMGDTATINAYGGKNVQTTAGFYGGYVRSSGNIDASGNISSNGSYANYIHSNGQLDAAGQIISGSRLTTNEYFQINGVAGAGNGCAPNGLQGRAGDGSLLSCVNGVWRAAGGASMRVCANYCGSQWPVEVGRMEHNGDWSSWRTLGPGCGGGYGSNWNEPVMCSSN